MAKRRRHKRSPSDKGLPPPVQSWQLLVGLGAVILIFALWFAIRASQ